MTDHDTLMCQAASRRQVVELADGRTGTLVYWPGRDAATRPRKRPLRHGDPLQAGVRLHPSNLSRVTAVAPHDIIAIVEVAP
jgi:hypothetical protein